MDKRQRLAVQRALAREAVGKLRAIQEYFDAGKTPLDAVVFQEFDDQINEFESWLFESSPIA